MSYRSLHAYAFNPVATTLSNVGVLIILCIFMSTPAKAVPGDQLFVEDFESGVPAWNHTVGEPGSWGVNAAFGYNAGYVAGDLEVRVTTPVTDLSGVAGARIMLTVIRGRQTTIDGETVSNKPENDENFELDFLDSDGNWQTVLVHFGGGTAGEQPAPLARRLSRRHHRGDAAGQQPGRLGPCLRAAAARGVAWLHPDRPGVPVFPVCRR